MKKLLIIIFLFAKNRGIPMTKVLPFIIIIILSSLLNSTKNSQVPFVNLKKTGFDEKVAKLLAYRIKKHNHSEGRTAHKKLIAMGSKAVPTLIYLAKKAAGTDPRIVNPKKHDDYGWKLRRPIQILVDIGDRRAIPLISTLVKYDHPKPRRMLQNLAELLCHGSDEQLAIDAKSGDPNIARAAKMALRDSPTFEYFKKKYRKKNR